MSTGTHRSACHVCFVAKPELSDPGRESVAKPTREQGLSFTATTGVTSGSSQETSRGMAQSPAPAPQTPTVPAPGGVVWGGRSALCRLRCGVSARVSCLERRAGYHHHRHPPGGPPALSTARPPTGLWAPAPTLAHFDGPLPAAAPHGRSAVSSGPHQATGRAALAPRASSGPSGAGGPLPLCAPPLLCRTMEIKQPWKSQRHPSPGHAKSESLKLSAGRGKTGPRTPVRGSRGDPGSPPRFFPPCRAGGREGPWPRDPPSWGRMGPVPHL